MRITNKIFNDLAIYMVSLGVGVGLVFPFFCLALGVPQEIALTPVFFIACCLAGVVLASLNIALARRTVGSRITLMSRKMKHIETNLKNRKDGISEEEFACGNYMIEVDSEDELGESAGSFNSLVSVLSEVLELNSEIRSFSEVITSNLEIDELSCEALNQLIEYTGAIGGAILIEEGGELTVRASSGIKQPGLLENNERLLETMKTHKRQIISFPEDVTVDGVIADFHPKEVLVEPILYRNSLLGVLILACGVAFPTQNISKLKFFGQELSLAFRNSITHEQMTRFAAIDVLTGLYNRRFGMRRLDEEFNRAMRSNVPLSLLIFDIDHFKIVNDTYGHLIGDKVLASVANIALSSIRDGDILVRYGGEEFLCVLPGAGVNDAAKVAERIRVMVMNSYTKHAQQEIRVTVSMGVVTHPCEKANSIDQLTSLADEAMYEAKKAGRNRVVSM